MSDSLIIAPRVILSVQYLRALAALIVLIAHSFHKFGQISTFQNNWTSIGGAGVDLFFIISGFVMCHATRQKEITIINFLKDRIIRIIPLYWTLTLIALCGYLIRPDLINSSGGTTSVINSFFLIPGSAKYLIQNGWTLSYEFYFYIIFSLGFLLPRPARLIYLCCALSLLVAVGLWCRITGVVSAESHVLNFLTNILLLEFLLGVLAYKIFTNYKIPFWMAVLMLIFGAAALICGTFFKLNGDRFLLWGVPFFIIFLGVISFERKFVLYSNNLISKILVIIGNCSYSLYLVHPFALVVGAIILKKIGLQQSPVISVLSLFVFSVLVGCLCYAWLETRLITVFKTPHFKLLKIK